MCVIQVVDKNDNGWWFVNIEDQFDKGWVPATYLQAVDETEEEVHANPIPAEGEKYEAHHAPRTRAPVHPRTRAPAHPRTFSRSAMSIASTQSL